MLLVFTLPDWAKASAKIRRIVPALLLIGSFTIIGCGGDDGSASQSSATAASATSGGAKPNEPRSTAQSPRRTEPPAKRTVTVVVDSDAEIYDEPTVGLRFGIRTGYVASGIAITNKLPRPISGRSARGLDFSGRSITESRTGGTEIPRSRVKAGDKHILDRIYEPQGKVMVRVQIESDAAKSLLGRVHTMSARLTGVWLEDDRGSKFTPIGFVLLRRDGSQLVRVDSIGSIRSGAELPTGQLGDRDELFLYFPVDGGVTIKQFRMGTQTYQQISGIELP